MRLSEREMKEILSQDIQVSDTVNNRLKDTYKMLKAEQKQSQKKPRRRFSYAAAAIAVVGCLAVPGAAYAAANLDFFDAMFGNSTKKSTPVMETVQEKPDQDGNTKEIPVTIPSHEFVSVDPEKAQELTGGGVLSEPIEKKLGDHTLRIENMVYDQNGAAVYFTLERPGGVTMLIGNDDTNVSKGAYFAEDRTYWFDIGTTSDDIFGGGNIYVDTEKSTADELYCTEYILWSKSLPDGVFPQLVIDKYPYSLKEHTDKMKLDMTKEEIKEAEEFYDQTEREEIALTDQKPVSMQKIDLGNDGCVEYSPISIGIDMSKGLGLDEVILTEDGRTFIDPCYLTYLEIKYKDGTSYIVSDKANNIDNTGYVLGGVGEPDAVWYETAFNRIVDINEIEEIIVNDKAFPVK